LGRPQIAHLKLVLSKDAWLGETKTKPQPFTNSFSMRSTLDLPPKLIDYLNERRAPLPPITDPDQPLNIDSLELIRLWAFLESDLNIVVEDDELLVDNFSTVRNMAKLINAKMKRLSAGGVLHAFSSGQSEQASGDGSC
jgi:acyl carrier protein